MVDGDIVCIELELLTSLTAKQESRQNENTEQLFILPLSVGRGARHFVESFVLSKLGYKKEIVPSFDKNCIEIVLCCRSPG